MAQSVWARVPREVEAGTGRHHRMHPLRATADLDIPERRADQCCSDGDTRADLDGRHPDDVSRRMDPARLDAARLPGLHSSHAPRGAWRHGELSTSPRRATGRSRGVTSRVERHPRRLAAANALLDCSSSSWRWSSSSWVAHRRRDNEAAGDAIKAARMVRYVRENATLQLHDFASSSTRKARRTDSRDFPAEGRGFEPSPDPFQHSDWRVWLSPTRSQALEQRFEARGACGFHPSQLIGSAVVRPL